MMEKSLIWKFLKLTHCQMSEIILENLSKNIYKKTK